ncbi:MAG TPA: GNAT family N-acetyltransferase [Paraburkholderia sp.]|nr:GNAT family N-acetyltransferase [Paraburkholderia sp.]
MDHAPRHILDNPVWSALTTRHAHLGQGGPLARRYHPEFAPFAAVLTERPESWLALREILAPDGQVAMLALDPVDPVEGLQIQQAGVIHQMVATDQGRSNGTLDDADVLTLGNPDAGEMLELATKTKPGPFSMRTHEMGHYIGVREQGKLIAMAGERMNVDGYVEISAVCVDPAHRGKGLAARLVKIMHRQIEERGDRPFLHVFDDNHSAIAVYERLGFELRQAFRLLRVKRDDS